MEYKVERYKFRIRSRGRSADFHGRILVDEDNLLSLEVWATSSDHAKIRLEVAPVKQRAKLWKLFHSLCESRGTEAIEYKNLDVAGAQWEPMPGIKK
jgi:hypothetical protein